MVLKFLWVLSNQSEGSNECDVSHDIDQNKMADPTFCYDAIFVAPHFQKRSKPTFWSRKDNPNLLQWIFGMMRIKASVKNYSPKSIILKISHNVSIEGSVSVLLPRRKLRFDAYPGTEIRGYVEDITRCELVYFDFVWQNPGEDAHFDIPPNLFRAEELSKNIDIYAQNRRTVDEYIIEWTDSVKTGYDVLLGRLEVPRITQLGWKVVLMEPAIAERVHREFAMLPTLAQRCQSSQEPRFTDSNCVHGCAVFHLPDWFHSTVHIEAQVKALTGKPYTLLFMDVQYMSSGCRMRPHVDEMEMTAVFFTSNQNDDRVQKFQLLVGGREDVVDVYLDRDHYLLFESNLIGMSFSNDHEEPIALVFAHLRPTGLPDTEYMGKCLAPVVHRNHYNNITTMPIDRLFP